MYEYWQSLKEIKWNYGEEKDILVCFIPIFNLKNGYP